MDDDRLVGAGSVARPAWFHATDVTTKVRVVADRRRHGVARLLWQQLEPRLPSGTTAHTFVDDDDPESLAVARHWGFVVYQHPLESILVIDASVVTSPPPANVTVNVLNRLDDAGVEELDALLHEADTSPESTMTGTNGIAAFASEPGTFAVTADVGDTPATICIVQQHGTDGYVLLTATRPAYRRQGLARLIKQHTHAVGFERGIRRFSTMNEEQNTPIRQLNSKLGYTRLSGGYRLRRPA